MTGYILLEMISENAIPIVFLFLLLCNIVPIYYTGHRPWTAARIRSYLNYILKSYFFAITIYVLVCVPFAYIKLTEPESWFDMNVKQMRECAYRFKENECGNLNTGFSIRAWVIGVERECFALAMCLRQPVFLLEIYAFLLELRAQVLNEGSAYIFLVGGFVAWGLSSGRWTPGMVLKAPNVNYTGVMATTPPSSTSNATTQVLEAGAQDDKLGI